MEASPQRFASLLNDALHRIKRLQGKNKSTIEDELGYQIGREGGGPVQFWQRGRAVPNLREVEQLATAIVERQGGDEAWLIQFLESAGFPQPALFSAQFFAQPAAERPPPRNALDPDLLTGVPDPAPLPPGSRMPLGRNPHFVGRAADLLNLAAALNRENTAAISQIETAATTGLGGIGKTQLACEFVHRYGQYFAGGVFWLSFDNARTVGAEVAACGDAARFDLPSNYALLPLEEQVRLVQTAWQEETPRLLVFDNCEDPALLARWRPTSGGCRVLVTSRRGEWDQVLGVRMLALGVLSRAESVDLLRHHWAEAERSVLGEIAAELGDLPLALHMAGSYLYRYRRIISPAAYLQQLRNADLLRHPSLQGHGISPTGHIQHVGRTFSLSYDRLAVDDDEIDRLARSLLVHMAHFAPGEPVWYDLLVRTTGVDARDPSAAMQIEDALARLIALGLVETEEDTVLRMHRLIAAFVRQVAGNEVEETQRAVEQVVFDAIAHANRNDYPMPLLARQAHLRAVVDRAGAREDEQVAALCAELGTYLWQIRAHEDALPYYEKALAIRQRLLGDDHLATAESLHLLGNVLRDLGRRGEARPCYEEALAVRERHLGPEHIDVAETLNHLGWLLWLERIPDPTHTYLQRAVAIAEKQLGSHHRLVADYANLLGLCLQDCLSEPARARPYFEQALRIRQALFGDEHPLVANSLNNMGYVCQALHDLPEARAYYEQTLAMRRKLWRHEHPEIAVSLKNLGVVLQAQGLRAEARALLEEALAIYLRTAGEQDPRTSFCLDSLGVLLHEQGELAAARGYLERALAVRRQVYRPNHPNLAVSLDHLGRVLAALGETAGGLASLQEALSIRQEQLGADHPLSRATRQWIDELADGGRAAGHDPDDTSDDNPINITDGVQCRAE